MKYCVYLIFIGGLLKYVGITRQPINKRIGSHLVTKPSFLMAKKIGQLSVRLFSSGISGDAACLIEKKIIRAYGIKLINISSGGGLGASPVCAPIGATHRVTIHLPNGGKKQIFCGAKSTINLLSPTSSSAWVRRVLLSYTD